MPEGQLESTGQKNATNQSVAKSCNIWNCALKDHAFITCHMMRCEYLPSWLGGTARQPVPVEARGELPDGAIRVDLGDCHPSQLSEVNGQRVPSSKSAAMASEPSCGCHADEPSGALSRYAALAELGYLPNDRSV